MYVSLPYLTYDPSEAIRAAVMTRTCTNSDKEKKNSAGKEGKEQKKQKIVQNPGLTFIIRMLSTFSLQGYTQLQTSII